MGQLEKAGGRGLSTWRLRGLTSPLYFTPENSN